MMPIENEKIELLQEAFSRFSAVSLDLERSYQLMEEQVQQLKLELKKSSAEKEILREQAERNLRLAAVGEMAARMAHELRNPLGSIELFSALLHKHLTKDPEKQQWAIHISSAVSSMDYALNNLLLFTGKPLPSFRNHDLKKIIEDARIFSLHLLKQNKVKFISRIDRIATHFRCDESLIKQIFLNLIINAVEAMPTGGTLTITGERCVIDSKERVKIRISDTGAGISEDLHSRIFDPFFTTKNKGTGLGLSIVHNAVQAHEGTIQVNSSPDEGATFTLILPLNIDTGETSDKTTRAQAKGTDEEPS